MKNRLLIAVAAISMSVGSSFAACPDQSASSSGTEQTTGISKDGTHAPLETPKAENDASNAVKKDGNTMPLASEEGGGDKNLATSQQDVEAQQQGDKTASAKADDEACKD
ncbi:hypothetical protein [Mesorhizobium sp. CAU 1732]|uniref:hypothetical protein n=1 Tax=Mesorhizobium sp. CAU 1732 TaxID=3140358 RepID=UPI003260760F